MKRSRLLLSFALMLAALLSFALPSVAQGGSKERAAVKSAQLDINSASKTDLMALPGIVEADALKIIASRPFKRKDELVTRKILPDATYQKIKDQIIAKQPKK
jgi:DNA uptake protein ComE-like DNA-binding protein